MATQLNTTPDRLQRARELFQSGAVHPVADHPGIFAVVNGHSLAYICDTNQGTCTCPDHTHRHVTCKHLLACYLHGTPEEPKLVTATGSAVPPACSAAPAAKPANGKRQPVAVAAPEPPVYLQPLNEDDPFS